MNIATRIQNLQNNQAALNRTLIETSTRARELSEMLTRREKAAGIGSEKPASVWEQITAKAAALRSQDARLSEAQAISEVCAAEPRLYSLYLAEAN